MAQKKAIRKGDTTTHGGTVLEGISGYEVMGKEMSCQGHMVSCPQCKGTYPILDGVSSMPIHGRYPAVEGMRTGCGALLIASQDPFTFEWTGNPATIMGDGVFAFNALDDANDAEKPQETFDEQLMLKNEDGLAFANFNYEITLENGLTVSGTTDRQGLTERIVTEEPMGIVDIEIFSDDPNSHCCSMFAAQTKRPEGGTSTTAGYKYYLDNVTTSSAGVGTSLKTVTLEGNARPLTSGEITLATMVFKDAVDYSKVKIHRGNYIPFQNENTAMTPNGEMYFPGETFKDDFSKENRGNQAFFIHEMVHVWQYQLGYPVKLAGYHIAISGGYMNSVAYNYRNSLGADRTELRQFNMEQQGNIIMDYFINNVVNPKLGMILSKFRNNPNDVSLLPHTFLYFV